MHLLTNYMMKCLALAWAFLPFILKAFLSSGWSHTLITSFLKASGIHPSFLSFSSFSHLSNLHIPPL